MATLDYVDIPAGATRLRASTSIASTSSTSSSRTSTSSDLRSAPRIYTSLPHPSPPSSPATAHRRQSSLSAGTVLTSPTLGFIPQLLLSSAIPGGVKDIPSLSSGSSSSTAQDGEGSDLDKDTLTCNDLHPEKYTLLSTRDPLSLPIMSNNFKRFVSKVGPIFWLQDRIEEVVMWKKGWKVTGTWMAVWMFLCWFPRMVLLVPHACIMGIILSTYPYPEVLKTKDGSGQGGGEEADHQQQEQAGSAPSPTEGSVPWQANIQAIQNLMGAVSDMITLIEPHAYHLVLSPAHFKEPTSNVTSSSSSYLSSSISGAASLSSADPPSPSWAPQSHQQFHPETPPPLHSSKPISPYTPHILTILALTFPVLAYVVTLPSFPARWVFLVGGLLPFACTHPLVQRVWPRILPVLIVLGGEALEKFGALGDRLKNMVFRRHKRGKAATNTKLDQEEEADTKRLLRSRKPLSTIIQRVIDDDHLSDKCWNSEMREVELWENERFGGDVASNASSSASSTASSGGPTVSAGLTWSKAHLKPGERTAWTRGRDGWSGVGVGGYHSSGGHGGVEAQGEVSNLTFSLAPGWSFVETEDWRKDVLGEWSGVGADHDGWVYTNDAWLGARPAQYTAGGGSVTRRRRWTRRVWFDRDRAEREK